jgi:hypothetical protein
MTIATTSTFVTYQGNGATTQFTFPFVSGGLVSDLQVITTVSGVETIVNPTLYSISFNPIPSGGLWSIGGTVTYPLSGTPISSSTMLTIQRIVPYVQEVTINNQGAFYPEAVEQAMDDLELQIQQLETGLLYTLQFPITDPVPPVSLPAASNRAFGYLVFDSVGQPYVSQTAPVQTQVAGTSPRIVNTTGTNTVNINLTDAFSGVIIFQSSTPVTSVQLPGSGGPYPIMDGSLNAGTNPLIILPPAGFTILGASKFTLFGNGSGASFYISGTEVTVQ